MKSRLRFWGVRGSLSCGSSNIGSHTSCSELYINDEHSIFFDAGTGIKAGSKDRQFKDVTLCLSHFHWDHIQGLPFFEALFQESQIEIISCFKDCKERLEVLFDERFHPVPLSEYENKIKFSYLEPGKSMDLKGLKLEAAELNHPGKSFAFKVSSNQASFVFGTDTDFEPLNDQASQLLKHADVAVLDSQYLLGDAIAKANYGHASFKKAVDVATNHFVKELYLYSLDLNYSDEQLSTMEAQAKDYASSVYAESASKVQLAREKTEREIFF